MKVQAKPRVIKATWTIEMDFDLSLYHGIDMEKELVEILKAQYREDRTITRKKRINNLFK